MDFEAHDDFPQAGPALDQFAGIGHAAGIERRSGVCHRVDIAGRRLRAKRLENFITTLS